MVENNQEKVLIVGSGIAGLACANFFQRLGINYEIVDKQKQLSNLGFEIAVWDNGRDILKKIRLDDLFDRKGRRVLSNIVMSGDGSVLADFSFSRLSASYGGPVTIVTREDLHGMLRKDVEKNIECGRGVQSLMEGADSVQVRFTDGSVQSYDFVIGADGVHSSVRKSVGLTPEYPEGWKAYYLWIPSHFLKKDSLYTVLTKHGSISAFKTKERAILTLFVKDEDHLKDEEVGRIERLKSIFSDAVEFVPRCFDGLHDGDVMVSDLYDVSLSQWHTNRVVVIGDAAHFCGPYAGMGASFALEDAYVLCAEIYKYVSGKNRSMTDAFTNFEKHQKPRIAHVLWITKKIKMVTNTTDPFLRSVMEWGLRIFSGMIPSRVIYGDVEELLKNEI